MITIIAKNKTNKIITIKDLSLNIPSNETIILFPDLRTKEEIANSNDLLTKISSKSIVINNGYQDLTPTDAILFLTRSAADEPRDKSGKLRVHTTPRKLGLKTYFTGSSDDITKVGDVGNGPQFSYMHEIGNSMESAIYADFNIIENETFLLEAVLLYKDCNRDKLSCAVVPSVVSWKPGTNTNFKLYNNYLIIPANGDGNCEITADLTDPRGGLVYMPNNDLNIQPTAFWDADWNTTTKKFENIRPNLTGTGRYNLFAYEVKLAKFVNNLCFFGSGSFKLDSYDTEELGHGMRIKVSYQTNPEIDHIWGIQIILTLFRERIITK